MGYFQQNAILGNRLGKLNLVVVEVKIVLNLIDFPKRVALALDFAVGSKGQQQLIRKDFVYHADSYFNVS